VAATITVQQANNVTNTDVSGIAIANVPTGATGDIVITFANTMLRCGVAAWRADNLLTITAHDADSSIANDPTVNLDVPDYGFAIGAGCTAISTGVTWTGLVEKYDAVVESLLTHSGASQEFATGQAARTITADFGSPSESSACFASWRFNPPTFIPKVTMI
jgi:hypothetical protein